MTKEEVIGTNTPEEVEGVAQSNRVSLVFKHPEILHTFNNYFLREYGTIQNYRIEVIEELLQSFNETKEIEYKKPLYYEENRKLQEDNNRLITENNNYEKQVQTLKTLTSKLQSYDKLKEDNIRLTEEVKMNTVTIDDMRKKVNELETVNVTEKQEHLQHIEDLSNKHETRINTIISTHDNTINELISKYEGIIKEKDHEIKELNKLVSGYALNFSNYRAKVESMGLLDRVRKRFPKVNDKIKELNP